MKPEPLKGKRVSVKVIDNGINPFMKIYKSKDGELVEITQIKSAVEWLKRSLIYKEEHLELAEEHLRIINEAFEDVIEK